MVSTKSCNAVVQPLVLIDETPLSQVDKQKYLGVVFDNKLTWSSHVAAVVRACILSVFDQQCIAM